MAQFHQLQVTDIQQNTSDCVVVTFAVPAELQNAFDYKQGQYLTLRAKIDGESVQRSYSLCSSPLDKEWKVGIKQVPYGKFSTWANQVLKVGDTVESLAPNGNFYVDVDNEKQKSYVCFAAGSGITPMLSIIEIFHFLTKQNRSVELFNGRVDEAKLDVIFKTICNTEAIDDYFICGPEAMIFLIRDFLKSQEVDESHIHFELFTSSGEKPKLSVEQEAKLKGKTCSVTLIEGGKSMNFELALGGDNVLDAALNNSADLPYACKGGVCCTCRAKLVEGEVEMAVTYGLEEDEIAAGYILTCQALPLTEKVVVDFDA